MLLAAVMAVGVLVLALLDQSWVLACSKFHYFGAPHLIMCAVTELCVVIVSCCSVAWCFYGGVGACFNLLAVCMGGGACNWGPACNCMLAAVNNTDTCGPTKVSFLHEHGQRNNNAPCAVPPQTQMLCCCKLPNQWPIGTRAQQPRHLL